MPIHMCVCMCEVDPPSQLNSSICILIPTCRSLRGLCVCVCVCVCVQHMHIKCGSLSLSTPPPSPVLNYAQRTVFHKLPKHVQPACTITANLTNHLPSNRSSLHCLNYISYLLSFHAQVLYVSNSSRYITLYHLAKEPTFC